MSTPSAGWPTTSRPKPFPGPPSSATRPSGIPEALFRETSEELGLSAFNPVRLCTYVWETERDSEFVFVHAIVGHPTLRPNAEEVSEGRWWSIPELEEAIGKNILTPNFESEFQRIKDQLLAML